MFNDPKLGLTACLEWDISGYIFRIDLLKQLLMH